MKKTTLLFILLLQCFCIFPPSVYCQNKPLVVRLGYIQGDLHHLPAFVALEKKIFTEQNVAVKIEGVFKAGPEMIGAFATNYLDVGYIGALPASLGIINKTANIKIIAQVNTNGAGIVVNKNSPIKNIEDLQGKRIAVPGYAQMQDYLLREVLTKHSIATNKVNIIILKPPEMINALRTMQIDAFIAWEPYVAKAVTLGVGRVLMYSNDIDKEHSCCVLVVSSNFYKNNPEKTQNIIKAHIKAIDYINQHLDEAIDIGAKYTGMDRETVKLALSNIHYTYQLNTNRAYDFLYNFEKFGYCKGCNSETIAAAIYDDKLLKSVLKK